MNFSNAKNSWLTLSQKQLGTDNGLANDIAESFISSIDKSQDADFRFIDLLCEVASASNPSYSVSATSAIFGKVIEPLCDDFSETGSRIAAKVILQIIDFIRHTPAGENLDSLLTQHGYENSSTLLARYNRILNRAPLTASAKNKVKKILILSRVTAGADIAITGIMVQRLAKSFPNADLVLIGPSHLADIFEEIPKIIFIQFIYKNSGSLLDKMTTWPDLLAIISKEKGGYKEGELLLFDPDTRLSQLGLLPLVKESETFYFPSRTIGSLEQVQKDLSTLANQWLNNVLSEDEFDQPSLFLNDKQSPYLYLKNKLKKNIDSFIVTVNFGVGNDPRKKLPHEFEYKLLEELLKIPNTQLILDNGRGAEEHQRVNRHLEMLQAKGIDTVKITETDIERKEAFINSGLLSYKGPLSGLSRLINIADCFIGYDSCGQHIANAAGTPAIIAFAGAPSTKFISRWSPNKPANCIIPIFHSETVNKRELDFLVENVLVAVKKINTKHT